MAFSTQRAVSDGTLQLLSLSINFFDKSEISVYLNNVPTSAYTWATANSIHMNSVVPLGVELLVRRTTDLSEVRHVFSLGAQFKDSTLDDDFRQILHIAQEAVEGANVGDIYSTLNMHGNKITNVGPAVADGDAISLGQVRTESQSAFVAAAQAQASATAAGISQTAAANSASAAGASATASANSATLSQNQVALAATQATNAANSATAALASKNAAATSETNASTSATNAANSATAAATAKTGAETARDAAINASSQVQYGTVPLFSVQWWGGKRSAIPAGYIPGDGQTVSRALYTDVTANVVAMMGTITDASWVATTTLRGNWATGDGSTTWRVPDLNGKSLSTAGAPFLRGDGTLSAAIQGTIQTDAFQGHYHKASFNTLVTTQTFTAGAQSVVLQGSGSPDSTFSNVPVTDGTNGTPRTASETRPLNVTGCFIIKVFGSVNNTGSVDANQIVTTLGLHEARINTLEVDNAKVYASRQIGDEHVNPPAGVYIHWGVPVVSRGITYNGVGGGRQLVLPVGGVYRISVILLANAANTGASLRLVRGGTLQPTLTLGYGGAVANTLAMAYLGRFNAGDALGVFVESGVVLNTTGGGQYNAFTVERIDN